MRVVVLAGGYDQIALIEELRLRGATVILIDYLENPPAKDFADIHLRTSTLDVAEVKQIAKKEKVDLITTACTDQAMLTVAQVSEELDLPFYLSHKTALSVTNKKFMKKLMIEGGVPTAKHTVVSGTGHFGTLRLDFPVVVKPSDCNSSKGVKKAFNNEQVAESVKDALEMSRSSMAIIEEYIYGREFSVDSFIIDGVSKILLITESIKASSSGFTIVQSKYPANLSPNVLKEIELIIQSIVEAFGLVQGPLLTQLIVTERGPSVIELSARMGGGSKYKLIETLIGFDIMKAYVDLITGSAPRVECALRHRFAHLNYCYSYPGIFTRLSGFEKLKKDGVICEYFKYKSRGSIISNFETSSDRVAGYLLVGNTERELQEKGKMANESIRILDTGGQNIMRYELI